MGAVTSLERESTLRLVMVVSRVADILPSRVAIGMDVSSGRQDSRDELGRLTSQLVQVA